MNKDIFSGKWQQMKGKVKEKWGKLTDNDLTRINGQRDELLGALKERYGWMKDRAEEELKRFEDSYSEEARYSKREKFPESTYRREEEGRREDEEGGEEKPRKRKMG